MEYYRCFVLIFLIGAVYFIYSPLKGTAVAMDQVPDETFATNVLGIGVAVAPQDEKVVAPADGVVSTLFDTHHAIGLTLDDGTELLIHIGINSKIIEVYLSRYLL